MGAGRVVCLCVVYVGRKRTRLVLMKLKLMVEFMNVVSADQRLNSAAVILQSMTPITAMVILQSMTRITDVTCSVPERQRLQHVLQFESSFCL